MNEDIIADFKRFIAATISQHMAGVATKDDIANMATKDDVARLNAKIDLFDKKMDDLQGYVSEALEVGNDSVDSQLRDHGRRITKLERVMA